MNIDKLKDLILYQSENGNVKIEVLYDNEDFWLTQKTMAELFNVAENNITYHLQNIFKSGELNKNSVTQKIRVTASDGKKYNMTYYNLFFYFNSHITGSTFDNFHRRIKVFTV